jgi:hypothetical protein
MVHGGFHMIFSCIDVRPAQACLLLFHGFVTVSIDHRFCPKVSLFGGSMVGICDSLEWARYELPHLKLKVEGLKIEGRKVVAIGWSSEGWQLARSLGWTAPARD